MLDFLSTPLAVALVIILSLVLIMLCILKAWKKVPPDKAAVIVGIEIGRAHV